MKRAAGFRVNSLEQDSVQVARRSVPIAEVIEANPVAALAIGDALHHVLSALPPFHAAVAHHLRDRSAAATAKKMGVSRRQVRAAVAEIRRRCEEAGLGS